MKGRVSALPMLGMVLIGTPLTFAAIGFGYWVSDLVYGAGLWPIGVVMRISLLLTVIGAALGFIFMAFGAIRTLIFGSG